MSYFPTIALLSQSEAVEGAAHPGLFVAVVFGVLFVGLLGAVLYTIVKG